MKPLACTPIAAVGETRRLLTTSMAGSILVGTAKDGGALTGDFTAGAFILADNDDQLIVGPIQIEAAQALARRVAEGDPRAMTEPQGRLILATALLALAHMWPRVPSTVSGAAK